MLECLEKKFEHGVCGLPTCSAKVFVIFCNIISAAEIIIIKFSVNKWQNKHTGVIK